MAEPLFISGWSSESDRSAVVAEADGCVWLHLTEPGEAEPSHHCWLFNTPAAPAEPDFDSYAERGLPPPLPRAEIGAGGVMAIPANGTWLLSWGPDGHSVALLLDDEPLGVIGGEPPRAMSRHLQTGGPWGAPWDELAAGALFGLEVITDGDGQAG